jgi:hypothetical protein
MEKKLKFAQEHDERSNLSGNISKDDSRGSFLKLKNPKFFMPLLKSGEQNELKNKIQENLKNDTVKIKSFKEDENLKNSKNFKNLKNSKNFENFNNDFSKNDRELIDPEESRRLFISEKIVKI